MPAELGETFCHQYPGPWDDNAAAEVTCPELGMLRAITLSQAPPFLSPAILKKLHAHKSVASQINEA